MPKRPDRAPALSQAYVSDSDEQERTENKATKRRISEALSRQVDEDSQSDGSDSGEASKKEENSENEESDDSEQESEGEDDDEDDDDDDDDGEQSSDEAGSQSSNNSKRPRQEDEAKVDQQPKRQKNSAEASTEMSSKSFVPPKGFNPLVLGPSDFVTESSEMFSALDGKQAWHICAPASVDVASIKELDLEAALRGEAIVSENGVSYSMQEMSSDDCSLMLMRGTSGIYRPSTAKIARSFRLAVKAGSGTKASSAQDGPTFVAQSPGQKKAARQQPEGLGMRYQPFGSETKARPAVGTSSAPQSPARKKTIQTADDITIADPMLTPSPAATLLPLSVEEATSPSKESKAAKAVKVNGSGKSKTKLSS